MAYENFQVSSSIAARMPGAKDLAELAWRAHWSFALRLVAHKGAPGGAPAAVSINQFEPNGQTD
jgi:hypothetical protein